MLTLKYPRRRNVTTSRVGLKKNKKQPNKQKTVTNAKISPEMVNPREKAGKRRRRRRTVSLVAKATSNKTD